MATEITNIHNLPDTFVRACMHDNHIIRGDISVTQLIDAPQIRYLRKRNDIQEDVIDRIWMLMGTAIHHILELSETKYFDARKLMEAYEIAKKLNRDDLANSIEDLVKQEFPDANNPDVLLEQNMSIEIDGMTISGTADKFIVSKKRLEDYKSTKVYAYLNEESRKKWEAQLNIYAYMFRQHGYAVDEAEIVAIFKDYSNFGRMKNKDYPNKPIVMIPIKLYSDKIMESYLKKRVALHRMADQDIHVPCTDKDRWSTGDKIAIKVPGRKTALKVDSPEVIEEWLKSNSFKYPNLYKEMRPGESRRCESFCPVRDVCPQFKEIKEAIAKNSQNIKND